ncbi:MAG: chemotaxis protein CheW [Cyanobacteria bacterium P01_F01_bin.150]
MDTQTYLLFRLNDLIYGIQTAHVQEIFQLPELTPMADAPGDMIGILNFRGAILPVMHLAKRLGQSMPRCHIQDRVILVDWEGIQVGMVVHQVDDVQSLPSSLIEPEPAYGHISPAYTAFVAGVAKIKDQLITLLNPETLIRQVNGISHMLWEARLDTLESGEDFPEVEMGLKQNDDIIPSLPAPDLTEWSPPIPTNFFDCYCPNSTLEEKHIFHRRARELRQVQSISNTDRFLPLAVVRLGDEYFGLALDAVKEFINIRQVTPIPCCPAHIIGDINLRGEVVTIIDIRKVLNLDLDTHPARKDKHANSKAIIVQLKEIIAGIIVDQVLDIIYVPPTDISSMPTVLSSHCQELFKGIVSYEPKPLIILDLQQLFLQDDLVVDQAA